jgi:hypothetical protein
LQVDHVELVLLVGGVRERFAFHAEAGVFFFEPFEQRVEGVGVPEKFAVFENNGRDCSICGFVPIAPAAGGEKKHPATHERQGAPGGAFAKSAWLHWKVHRESRSPAKIEPTRTRRWPGGILVSRDLNVIAKLAEAAQGNAEIQLAIRLEHFRCEGTARSGKWGRRITKHAASAVLFAFPQSVICEWRGLRRVSGHGPRRRTTDGGLNWPAQRSGRRPAFLLDTFKERTDSLLTLKPYGFALTTRTLMTRIGSRRLETSLGGKVSPTQ